MILLSKQTHCPATIKMSSISSLLSRPLFYLRGIILIETWLTLPKGDFHIIFIYLYGTNLGQAMSELGFPTVVPL